MVEIEKWAVINLLGRDAPERRAVGLGGDQSVEQVEAAWIADRAIEQRDRRIERDARLGASLIEGGDPPLDHFLLAQALGQFVRVGLGAWRQVAERRQDALQLDHMLVRLAQHCDQGVELFLENWYTGARRHWQPARAVFDRKGAVVVHEPEFALFQHIAVLILEDRQQDFVLELILDGLPIDIKIAGIWRAGAIL